MATSRALIHLVQRRHLLCCAVTVKSAKIKFYLPTCMSQANFAEQKSMTKTEQTDSPNQVQVGFAEVVKENTKSAWYLSVIIGGVGVTAVMFYAIFRELFSSKSPNSVYSKALDKCINDPKVVDTLGTPIKAFGEETRRGRRGHVSHALYEKNGVPHMRMKFYIKGSRKQGTVHLEVREDSNGNWMYRYLFVECQDLQQTVILLEDNRKLETAPGTPQDIPLLGF
ncbi:hypothetical protein QAD02_016803 [Eretmocerus hayati]|uniref:Uncharacterized protein n=1 Tax=Eretmocerus hayati TaxID=131215 RepID=A0ACC2PDD0_9HYME|nr:hypothetical protein QAD02_016803 [Eretmocerus hayati]